MKKQHMVQDIDLSIIIVNFNTYKFLANCIKSIFRSTLGKLNYEIIIVDNASEDDSVKLIRRKFHQLRLIENRKNIGFSKANNQAIRLVKSNKYILFLNPDTIINNCTLLEMINFMDKNTRVGVSTPRVELPNGNLDDACHRGFPTPWNTFCQFSGLAKIFPSSQFFNSYHLGYENLDKIHEIDCCTGAFMLVKKEAGDNIGWFDEDYFWYGEDLDFCYRLKLHGWKVMFLPDIKITHFKGVSSGIKKHSEDISTASKKIKRQATSARFDVMRIFYKKHYQKKYPKLFTFLILLGIKIKEFLAFLFIH